MRLLPSLLIFVCSHAAAVVSPPSSQTGPVQWNAKAEVGLQQEASEFPVVRIDASPAIPVAGSRTRSTDLFRRVGVAADANAPLAGPLRVVANVNYDSRTGSRGNQFDTEIAHGDLGAQLSLATTSFMLRAVREQWDVSGKSFRSVTGVSGTAVKSVSADTAAIVTVDSYRYAHPAANAFLDSDYRAVTLSARRGGLGGWNGAVTGQITLSREDNRGGDPSLDFSGRLWRVAWEAQPRARWQVGTAMTGQSLRASAFDPVLGAQRDDRYLEVDAFVKRTLSDRFAIRFEIARSRYRSSADVVNNDWMSAAAILEVTL